MSIVKIRIFIRGCNVPNWIERTDPPNARDMVFLRTAIAIRWRGTTHIWPVLSDDRPVIFIDGNDAPCKVIGGPTIIHLPILT